MVKFLEQCGLTVSTCSVFASVSVRMGLPSVLTPQGSREGSCPPDVYPCFPDTVSKYFHMLGTTGSTGSTQAHCLLLRGCFPPVWTQTLIKYDLFQLMERKASQRVRWQELTQREDDRGFPGHISFLQSL